MTGFSSKKDFTRYGNLYALSCLLSNQEFWFCGELHQACEAKNLENLRRHLIKSYPPIWEFASVIHWEKLAESAIAIYEFGLEEHNRLIKELNTTSNTLS